MAEGERKDTATRDHSENFVGKVGVSAADPVPAQSRRPTPASPGAVYFVDGALADVGKAPEPSPDAVLSALR